MNNSPEDPGGYSSAAFGSLCTAISPRRAARFDRHFVLSCGRNRKFKLSRIHIIAEINRFIALRSDDNIDPSLFNFKLNRNHITRLGIDNMCIGFAHPREPQEEIILIFYAVPVKNFGIAAIPLSTFAGEPSQNVGKSFIKSYCAVCLEGTVIVLFCIIFSLFASSPPSVNPDAAAVTQVWSYVGELFFNMLVLVGSVKMSDRIIREMMGL